MFFSFSSFADDASYVDIGLTFNNDLYNSGTFYGDGFELKKDDQTLAMQYSAIDFEVESNYRIQIGDSYDCYYDLLEAFQIFAAMDIPLNLGFNGKYLLYSKSFELENDAIIYKNYLSELTSLPVKIITLNNKIILKSDDIDVVVLDDNIFIKSKSDKFSYRGINYRGDIKLYLYNEQISVINHIKINEYLYGVVPKEMTYDWPLEALKAQAVVARSYLVKNIGAYDIYGFDICGSFTCQAYGGMDAENIMTNKAVDDTNGKIVTYDGNVIATYYHSNSGGYTANSENVWSTALPYLKAVYDPYSIGEPYSSWSLKYTESQLIDIIRKNGYNGNSVLDISADQKTFDGRVQKLSIQTDIDKIVLDKEDARKFFGYTELKSIVYTVQSNDKFTIISKDTTAELNLGGLNVLTSNGAQKLNESQSITFKGNDYESTMNQDEIQFSIDGKGWGHGIGLSQYGAKVMAERGFNYEEIIKFYYTNVELN